MNQKKPDGGEGTIITVDTTMENGTYANAATVIHSPNEFLLDFVMILPGGRRKVVSRVILSPAHAKTLSAALAQNVGKYETAYGPIDTVRGVKDPGFDGTVN